MTISIRPVTTIEQVRTIVRLEIEIWGSTDLEAISDHLLLAIAKEGGVVLLAHDEAGAPVGFGYGFLSLTEDNRLKIASHQVGVLPAYQDRGLGFQIKLAQRSATLARNIDLITWTFDPLQGRNARFNLRKLGAVCNTYLPNLYGDMQDELNQGLPTDRFRADWWIATAHVVNRITGRSTEQWLPAAECPVLNPATILKNGLSAPADTFDMPAGDSCLVEIPAHIQQLKVTAPDLALKWRLQTRRIFEFAFTQGYTAIDLLRREGRHYYLLQKNWQPDI
jgi:predicted GNAT superfamily acetyltransferase